MQKQGVFPNVYVNKIPEKTYQSLFVMFPKLLASDASSGLLPSKLSVNVYLALTSALKIIWSIKRILKPTVIGIAKFASQVFTVSSLGNNITVLYASVDRIVHS